jgi:Concanavalin A-like lectin/glucanases superfamily
LVLAIPGGAVSAATSTYDVTGQIRYETPTTSYDNAGIVTYSNSLGIGTYQNKTVTNFTAPGTTYSNGTATNNGYYGSIDKTLMFDGNLNTYASWATDGITFTFTSSVPFTTLRLYCYVPTTPGNPAYFAVNGVSQTITKDTWLWHTVTGVSSPLSTIYGYGANGAPSIAAIEVNGSILIDGGFNITIDSNIKKYYNRSMKFRGNNYLSLATSNDFSPGTGDFTVEYWAYYSTVGPTVVVGATNGLWIGQNGANFVLRAYGVADLVSYSGSPPTNKWVHIAVTRQGTTAKIFFDGIQVASGTTSQNFIQSTLYIGTDSAGTYSSANITDLRIYKGVAKYTSNFTPPNQIYLT